MNQENVFVVLVSDEDEENKTVHTVKKTREAADLLVKELNSNLTDMYAYVEEYPLED